MPVHMRMCWFCFALLCFHRMLVYHTGRRTYGVGWELVAHRGQPEQYYIRVTGSMCFGVVGWLTTGSALDSTLFA
jgi:hypothetical protein